MSKRIFGFFTALMALGLMVPAILAATPVTVDNIGDDWHVFVQDADASYDFVDGPATPPEGSGSLEMVAVDLGADKVTILTDNHDGKPIADIEALSYWTYRDSSSTSAGHAVPSINIFITDGGPNGDVSWAPLIWEPLYPYGATAFEDDEWQEWDTMSPSGTGFEGGWWSTRVLGDICDFNCFVSWETVLNQNPYATIIVAPDGAGSLGVNLGRGPGGSFVGNVDALSVTFDGDETTYDFEPTLPTKDDCKNGGHVDLDFRNQGQCIANFQSNDNSQHNR